MIRCDQCQEWFHFKCNSITIDILLVLKNWYTINVNEFDDFEHFFDV